MDFAIYTLSDPVTDELRYVGKTGMGLEKRLQHHIWPSALKERTRRAAWIKGLLARGQSPKIELLEEHPTQALMDEAEIFWIEQFRALGFRLVNTSDGGDGWSKGQKRGPMSDAGKRARSEALKGRSKPPRGPEHTANNARAQGARPLVDDKGNLFSTIGEAARSTGAARSCIRRCLQGLAKKAAGRSFKYVEDKE